MMTTQMRPLAFINARVIDPAGGTDVRGGVLIADGVISAAGADVTAGNLGADVRAIDCKGDIVTSGLIDLRVFVGEPGGEHRETIASASAAAAAGGVTTIVTSPDAQPVVDDPAVVDFLKRRARDNAHVRVLPSAALTKGLRGQEIAEIGLLQEAGAVAFTDADRAVRNSQVMLRALSYARDYDALIMHQAQDADLVGQGVMNAGERASRLGLGGIHAAAEAIGLDRDMRLLKMVDGRYHASIVSSSLSLDVIARAKADGLKVTCATTINHLTLNENDIGDYRTFLKLMPPLRHEDERMALVRALADGLIDVVMSDHNPQDVETKRVPFSEAAFGAIGLETMLAAGLRLVHSGEVSLVRLLNALSTRPADLLRLPQGRVQKGAPADVICFDMDEPFVLDPTQLRSRSKNTPFDGARLQGRVKMSCVAGQIIFGSDAFDAS
jgi:dihydroorotase